MRPFHKKIVHKTKKNCQYLHSKQRAMERYHIDLNHSLHKAIVKSIQENRAVFIQRQSIRVSMWVVDVYQKKCLVLYDTHRKSLITFLPREKKYYHLLGSELICDNDCKYCNSLLNKEDAYLRKNLKDFKLLPTN